MSISDTTAATPARRLTPTQIIRLILALLLLVSITFYLYRSFRPMEVSFVGTVLAEQVNAWLAPTGSVVIVELEFAGEGGDVQRSPNVRAFRRGLRGVKVLAVEPLGVSAQAASGPPALTVERYRAIRNKYPRASAIVSFMGVPMLLARDVAALTEHGPALVAFCPALDVPATSLREWYQRGLVQALVVPRPGAAESATVPTDFNSRAWFDEQYLVLTRDNLEGELTRTGR